MSSAVPTDGEVLRASPFIRTRVHSPVGTSVPVLLWSARSTTGRPSWRGSWTACFGGGLSPPLETKPPRPCLTCEPSSALGGPRPPLPGLPSYSMLIRAVPPRAAMPEQERAMRRVGAATAMAAAQQRRTSPRRTSCSRWRRCHDRMGQLYERCACRLVFFSCSTRLGPPPFEVTPLSIRLLLLGRQLQRLIDTRKRSLPIPLPERLLVWLALVLVGCA